MNDTISTSDILIVGCGDLGLAVARTLAAQGHRVTGLRRSAMPLPDGIPALAADVTQPHTLAPLAELRPAILLYCVAADAQTDDSYRAHYVDGLRNTLAALPPGGSLRHVFFVSSTRVYGQQTDALLDEDTAPLAADFGGERLLQAEALLDDAGCPATALRLSGIYGPGRTRLLRLADNPAQWPAQNSWTNRIHRDDAAAFIVLLIARALAQQPLARDYLVTDSAPVAQYEVLRWLAEQLGNTGVPATDPALSGGKRLGNARMLSTGYALRYPSYREGYGAELRAYLAQTPSAGPTS